MISSFPQVRHGRWQRLLMWDLSGGFDPALADYLCQIRRTYLFEQGSLSRSMVCELTVLHGMAWHVTAILARHVAPDFRKRMEIENIVAALVIGLAYRPTLSEPTSTAIASPIGLERSPPPLAAECRSRAHLEHCALRLPHGKVPARARRQTILQPTSGLP